MNDLLMKDLIKELRANRINDREIVDCEIAARDRVDISLEKYEQMRDEIEELKQQNEELKEHHKAYIQSVSMLLSKLDIPFESIKIKPESITMEKYEDLMDYTTKYVIMFKTDRMV